MYPKYVCPPEYSCSCYQRGKSVSRSTMLRHKKIANNFLRARGLRADLPKGPVAKESMVVSAHFQSMVDQSMMNATEVISRAEDRRRIGTDVASRAKRDTANDVAMNDVYTLQPLEEQGIENSSSFHLPPGDTVFNIVQTAQIDHGGVPTADATDENQAKNLLRDGEESEQNVMEKGSMEEHAEKIFTHCNSGEHIPVSFPTCTYENNSLL
ncbi:hypothetical protein FGB62_270g07 [Gracilaria domingensis]|nr:hypothetical protein FGB62_270g07 [Gracilaria domingensis]